jgi:hypothetical protein
MKGNRKAKGKGTDSIQNGTLGKGKGKGKDSIQKGTLGKRKGKEKERERIPYRKEP